MFAVKQTKTYPRDGGRTQTIVSYWEGPAHGWGNTWSGHPTDYAVATFETAEEAEAAYRATLGDPRPGVEIIEVI